MREETVNVAIKKPLHAKLRKLAKSEQKTVRTVTNNILADGVEAKQREASANTGERT